jgi:F-type H+-transporting ATPase subunit a
MVGTLLADVIVLGIFLTVASNLKEIPGRFQMAIELLTGALDGLAKSIAGVHARRLFPLMATIFVFLLVANWLELIPGVDSVGIIHCAEEGMNGYPTKDFLGMKQLKVDEMLDSGETATEADYHACELKHEGHGEEEAATSEEEDEAEVAAVTEGEGGEGGEGTAGEEAAAEGEEHAAAAEGAVEEAHGSPDREIVTPFVRAAATDLNLTIALALIAFCTIQYFGFKELNIGYLAKFINTPALEKGDVMTFGVGFLELVSELSKILSFAFRLFGNIFAGQVLLFVISFLVATGLPGAIYGLEFFVGIIQAGVFAMLFLVFATMAMASHGDHGDHDEHEAHH